MQPLCDEFFADSPSAPAEINACSKGYLEATREYLLKLHDSGAPARAVNEERADLVDRLVRRLFRLAEDIFFANFPRLGSYRLAIVATGGTGRRELAFGSDIDLLFLFRGKLNPYVETITEALTHRLWDGGLQVAAMTRTQKDCERVGREDLATLTSYLDARLIIGDVRLFRDFEVAVERWVRRDAASFIDAKLEESRARHERFGESPNLLQPDLRESMGGLRDAQTAVWIARAVRWEVRRPDQLAVQGFLRSREQAEFLAALDFLWRVRNELHREGRKEDRLHFDAQERVAAHLGFKATETTLSIEELMSAYYLAARSIRGIGDQVIDKARRLLASGRGRPPAAPQMVEEGFAISEGHLEIPTASLLRDRPVRLLAAFAVAQAHDAQLSLRARLLVREHVSLIDEDFRSDPEASRFFLGILGASERVYRSLEAMNDLGVLGAYLPEFGHVVGLWRHDLYHTYTVDAHSLFLVEQLRRLVKRRYEGELSLPTELIREVVRPELLMLAGLLHDIGKGRGGSHPRRGADLLEGIAERLGLKESDAEEVRFLIRHHLTLSELAERRDVNDSRVILNLASLVGNQRRRLRNLYLLTVADIRAVSTEAWSPWKAGLLEALYRNAIEWIEAGAMEEQASEFFLERSMRRAESTQELALRATAEAGVDSGRALEFLETMPRRYLLMHGPNEIAQHIEAALAFSESLGPVSVSFFDPESPGEGFQGVIVVTLDRPGLLSITTGVLLAAGRNILGAQAYTSREGLALDIYELSPIAGGGPERALERERLEGSLQRVLEGRRDLAAMLDRLRSPLPRVFRSRPPSVRFSNEDSEFCTVIDVSATDRPGLLHDVTRVLSGCGLDIIASRVSTRASRVTDAFYVTVDGHKLLDSGLRRRVELDLLEAMRRGLP